MKTICEHRKSLAVRSWHVLPVAAMGIGLFILSEWVCLQIWGALPGIMDLWAVLIVLPMLVGAAVTRWAGSATLTKRALYALICGLITGLGAAAAHIWIHMVQKGQVTAETVVKALLATTTWGVLPFALLAVVGAIIYEIKQPLPKTNDSN
jgi:hypothetical protein